MWYDVRQATKAMQHGVYEDSSGDLCRWKKSDSALFWLNSYGLWLLNVISSPLTSPLERWFAFATDGAIWVPHKPRIIFLIVLSTKLSSTQPIAAPYIGCPCAILGLQTLYATVSPLLSSLKRRTGLPHCHHILPWAPVAGQGARQVRSGAEPSRWPAIHQTGSSLLIAFGCIWLCAGLYLVHIWLRLMLSHLKTLSVQRFCS